MVYPLDFEEFLWAKGISTDVIELLQECYTERRQVPTLVHEQVSRYWREYLVVGLDRPLRLGHGQQSHIGHHRLYIL